MSYSINNQFELNEEEQSLADKLNNLNPGCFIKSIREFYGRPNGSSGIWIVWHEWLHVNKVWKGLPIKSEDDYYIYDLDAQVKLGELVGGFVESYDSDTVMVYCE